MTKKEYLDKLKNLHDVVNVVAEKIIDPNELINVCRLKLEILTAMYNCLKEN